MIKVLTTVSLLTGKIRLRFYCFGIKAGNSVRDDIVSSLIGIISSTPDLHGYTALQLFKMIRNDITQQPLSASCIMDIR